MIKTFPTLFKTSSTGKISEWTIVADNKVGGGAFYEVTFGYTDGKKQSTSVNVDIGKNIDKQNETSPYQQACAEAESKWKKQLDKGYIEDKSFVGCVKASRISPMLAHKYDDYKHKVSWPCYWQPKLDGVRCMAWRQTNGTIVLQSRQGKLFNSLPHIIQELESTFKGNPDVVLDGELYVHNEDFQELIHLIKRDEPHADSVKIEYHVYDIYNKTNPNMTFSERSAKLVTIIGSTVGNVKFVKTGTLGNEGEMRTTQRWAEMNGYEGIMLRNCKSVYKLGHRSSDLLKVKQFQDAEFEIVGGYENKGRQEGQCTIVCKTNNGTQFGVKPEGTDSERQWYWDNLSSIIGKKLTVRFFSWTTSKNPVPRFPIGVCVRDYD